MCFDKSLDILGRNELVILNSKELERVKKEYTRTGREYQGATHILQEEISKLKTELVEIRLHHQIEFQKQQNETDKYKTLAETTEQFCQLEKKNYELQIQLLVR
jgi:phosphoenolpyruvate carboxylase